MLDDVWPLWTIRAEDTWPGVEGLGGCQLVSGTAGMAAVEVGGRDDI